jgi:pimeloyl-ACP methyl ester carboxylesterase
MEKLIAIKEYLSLAYTEVGPKNGYPILIQHGLIASIQDTGLFESLANAGMRVICIARPGYGESTPYALKSYLEWGEIIRIFTANLHLTQFDIIAISSGSPYGYAMAVCLPQRVRRLFILSGMPALYDPQVRAIWPHPLDPQAKMAEMQKLAHELFFSNLSEADLRQNDIHDSMRNDTFGVAQDLCLRGRDWGFTLNQVKVPVFMRHSQADDAVPVQTAMRTAELVPQCTLELTEKEPHFSASVLDDFISRTVLQGTG